MFRKRILSTSAAVVLGLSTVMVPTAGAQETGDATVVSENTAFDPRGEYPGVEWNDEGYSEPVSGNESLNCFVDWNAATILDQRLTDYQNNAYTKKVFDASHGEQSDGYSSLQHFYSGGTNAVWRPVVAFDADVNDATVVLTVPEAKAGYTTTDKSDWLINSYFPVVNVSAYTTPVSPVDVKQGTAVGVTTVAFYLGDVKKGSGFAAQVGGDVGENGVRGSLRTTGTFVPGQETVEDCGSGTGSSVDGSSGSSLAGSSALLAGSSKGGENGGNGDGSGSSSLPGSSLGSSGSENDGENGGTTGGSSDVRCVQAAATVGIPLLALLPIGLATQVNIPGLTPLVADAQTPAVSSARPSVLLL